MKGRLFTVAAIVLLWAVYAGADTVFQGLGQRSSPGATGTSFAYDVSADGTVVVGTAGGVPFRWTAATGMVGLGYLPGADYGGTAWGVSADGTIIVGETKLPASEQPAPFRWTAATGMLPLGNAEQGFRVGRAYDVSADGSVIVGFAHSPSGRAEAFRWTEAAGPLPLGFPPEVDSIIGRGISSDGSIIVGWSHSASGYEGFRWTEADGIIAMPAMQEGDYYTSPSAASANGAVIVGAGTTPLGTEAFRWTSAEGAVSLGDLPGGNVYGQAHAVSADGSVVVGSGHTPTGTGGSSGAQAFYWDRVNGMRNLRDMLIQDYGLTDLIGWKLESAEGVSADGLTIVGFGHNPFGSFEAWRCILPPEELPMPGDANDDGLVDDLDLTTIATHWQTGGGLAQGDLSGDGFVSDLDLTILATAWPSGGLDGSAVPEPATVSLLLFAVVGLLARRDEHGKAV